jgi:hypothetical protein
MYTQIDGFIAPCLWGIKEKKSAYLFYSEGMDDVMIQTHNLPYSVVAKGGKMRLFGELNSSKGITEMSVDKYVLLN